MRRNENNDRKSMTAGERKAIWKWPRRLILFALISAGCASLDPIDLPQELAPPPEHSTLWDSVGTAAAGDWHVLLNTGPAALDWRLRTIDSASSSIDLQTFLWHFDTSGAMVLNHLIAAAERGVEVRILIDDSFLVQEDELILALAEHPNIEYRVFNPFKRRSGGFATRQLLNLAEFSRLDHRMHNKAMVIDNQVAIVGGRNLADAYFGLDSGANFRDLELLLGGSIVEEVSTNFDIYWNNRWSFPVESISHRKASAEQLAEARRISTASPHVHDEESLEEMISKWLEVVEDGDTGNAILFADNPPADNPKSSEEAPIQVANELIDLFDSAESEILVVSAYLIPTPELERAVKRALDRGVRVRILTNSIGSNNHLAAHSAYRNHIDTLLKHGAELHETRIHARDRGRYILAPITRKTLALHAKAVIFDGDKVFVGSANLDPRSLRINTEMGFLVVSRPFNKKVREALESDFSTANAWRLELQSNGKVIWVADDQTLESQPALSSMQRIEDWFFSNLPIESEL